MLEIELDGIQARYMRLLILTDTGFFNRFAIADAEIIVGGGYLTEPREHAIVGSEYRYRPVARIPGASGTIELIEAPDRMVLDEEGLLRWTPDEGDVGTWDVQLLAGTLDQTFTINVASRTLLASSEIDLVAGGEVVVADTGSALDGLVARVAPGWGEGTETLNIYLVDGEDLPNPAEGFEPVGSAFQLQWSSDISVPIALVQRADALTSLPGVTSQEHLFLGEYGGQYQPDDDGRVIGVNELTPMFTTHIDDELTYSLDDMQDILRFVQAESDPAYLQYEDFSLMFIRDRSRPAPSRGSGGHPQGGRREPQDSSRPVPGLGV